MAERTPLRIATVAGVPIIAEFQPEDAIAVSAGGTGASSIPDFKTNIGLTDLETSVGNLDSSVGDISGYINSQEAIWAAGGADVTALQADVTALQADVTSLISSAADISGYISDNEASWLAGGGGGVSLTSFDELDGRVTTIETDTTGVDFGEVGALTSIGLTGVDLTSIALTSLDGRVTSIETDTTGVDFGEVGALTSIGLTGVDLTSISLTSLDGRVTSIENDTTGVDFGEVGALTAIGLTGVDLTSISLTSLEASVGVNANDINLIDNAVSVLEGRVTTVESDLTGVYGDLTSLDLNDLTSVTITTPTNGQGIIFNSTSNKWENATISTGGVTDHGALNGLGDNDHPQYLLSSVVDGVDFNEVGSLTAIGLTGVDLTSISLTSLDGRVTSIETDTTGVDFGEVGALTAIGLTGVDLTSIALTSLDERITSNDSDIVGLDNRIDALEADDVSLTSFQAVAIDVTGLQGDVAALQAAGTGSTIQEPHNTSGVVFCSGPGGFGVGGQPTANNQRLAWNTSTGKPEWGLIGGGPGTTGYILESNGAGGESWVPKSAFDDLAPAPGGANEFILWTGSEYRSYNLTAIDHGILAGLEDNDHPHYELTSVNLTLSDLVTSVEGSTVSLSAYIAANEAAWLSDNDVSTLSGLGDTSITGIADGQIIQWDEGGQVWVNDHLDHTVAKVYNNTAAIIYKGDVVTITGAHNANTAYIDLARADSQSSMPAIGVAQADIAVSSEGLVVTFGRAAGLNTSGMTEGGKVYVSPTTKGGITQTRPTATNHLVQNVGVVMKADATNGVIKVTGIGRSNDVDNITLNNISTLSSLTASIETSTVDISSYIAANEGTWSTGGGGGVSDHSALSGLTVGNDHPQYVLSSTNNALSSLVTNIETSTVDISSYIANNLFSGNIEVTGTNPLHIGTIGTVDTATFGMQSAQNTAIIAPSLILSATSAYQFRKEGSTTYTDTDFPQSCRNWDSAYNTVLNSSSTWGGGGGTSVQTPLVSGSLYHYREGFINSINNRDVETGTFWVAGGGGVVIDITDYNQDTRSSVAGTLNSAGDRWTYWPIPNLFRTANAADGDEMLLEARVKLVDSIGTGGGISVGFVDWDGNNAIAYDTRPPGYETYAEDHANIHFDIANSSVQIAHLDSGGGSTPTVTDLGASYPMSDYVDVWYRVAAHIKYNSASTNWDVQFYIDGSAVGSPISHSLTGSIVPFVGSYYGTGATNAFVFNVDWFDVQFKIGDDASEAYLDMNTL